MSRFDRTYLRCSLVLVSGLGGCAPFWHPKSTTSEETESGSSTPTSDVAIAMPQRAAAVRDDRAAPILQVATAGNVVFPYVYGYPIYPEGDAARGISQLRSDNWSGARQADRSDESGVVHATEDLPQLGCKFEGIRENAAKFVPISLTCDLPAPKALGGAKKPVLDDLSAGAKAEQLLQDKTIQSTFMGAFHLTSDDFAAGSGTGYFNTTHGQLAFVFAHKKLTRFVYYFDPSVTAWQNPALWVKP